MDTPQELFLAVLVGSCGMLGIEPEAAVCEANALPTIVPAPKHIFYLTLPIIIYHLKMTQEKLELRLFLHDFKKLKGDTFGFIREKNEPT